MLADHILFFVFGIVIPLLGLRRRNQKINYIEYDTQLKKQIYYSNGVLILTGALAVVLVGVLTGKSWSGIGFSRPMISWPVILLTLAICMTYLWDIYNEVGSSEKIRKAKERWTETTPFLPVTKKEFLHFIFMACAAGIGEEVIYRGFMIPYLQTLIPGPFGFWMALLFPAVVFGIIHFYHEKVTVIKIMALATALGVLFILSKSLWIVILLHAVIDILGGYFSFKWMKDDRL